MNHEELVEAVARVLDSLDPNCIDHAQAMRQARAALSTAEPLIRADERHLVEWEIVAWLKAQCSNPMLPQYAVFLANYADALKAGDYRKDEK